jgi:hypothetical protein
MPSQTQSLDTAALLGELRGVFGSGRIRELVWRLDQLRRIERLCDEREAEIAAALAEDLGRPPVDFRATNLAHNSIRCPHHGAKGAGNEHRNEFR